MADVPTNVNGRHGFRFDPTINLGHMVSAGVFLVCAGVAYASMDARVSKLETELSDARNAPAVVAPAANYEAILREKDAAIEDLKLRLTQQAAAPAETPKPPRPAAAAK